MGLERYAVIPEVIPSKGEALFQRNHSLVEGFSKREIGVTLPAGSLLSAVDDLPFVSYLSSGTRRKGKSKSGKISINTEAVSTTKCLCA